MGFTVHEKVLTLIRFYEENQRLPQFYEEYNGVKIGVFLANIRAGNIKISQKDRQVLEYAGIDSEAFLPGYSVHEKVLILIEFFNKEQRIPRPTEVYKNVKLGDFCRRIKYGRTKLSSYDQKLLNKNNINIYKSSSELRHYKNVQLIIDFVSEYKRLPKSREVYRGVKLGSFLCSLREGKVVLSDLEKSFLEKAGVDISKNPKDTEIINKVSIFVEFFKKSGRFPKKNEMYKGVNLGRLLESIKFDRIKVSNEAKKLISDAGIDLNMSNAQIRMHQKTLLVIEFYDLYGRTPKSQEKYKGTTIGNFFYNVKNNNIKLSSEDKELLNFCGIIL